MQLSLSPIKPPAPLVFLVVIRAGYINSSGFREDAPLPPSPQAAMVNFQDPAIVQADFLAFVKFLHVVDGIYIWEFFTSLDYEWSVITGKRPYRWTIWIYSLTRITSLMAVVVDLIGFNVTAEINCEAWLVFLLIFAYVAWACASLLMVLRVSAIWNRNWVVMALSAGVWLTNVGFLLHGIATAKAVWVPAAGSCSVLRTADSRDNIVVTLGSDITLLVIMLLGLLNARQGGSGSFGIWRMLFKQGLMWLALATVAEVPPAVFILLNLNDAWNLMFQTPTFIVMSIAATRMYRELTDFNSVTYSHETSTNVVSTGLRIRGTTVNPVIPMSRLEVSVHTAYEGYEDADKNKHRIYNDEDGRN
ncbi:hypothetical protein BV25DRAFT_1827081 [Artomyces pyxidatus]|uniref:Uncharacterized protein n=1 Tax=Artomyces pyxidatus TaxID=48021 RepID=A0ACB8SXJ5_9AGAM|nr:hypothetical protein BV25DRAFT_1827081 [Artomyces pyxidatus]